MSLKKCDECGSDLSTTATKRPHCGAERTTTTQAGILLAYALFRHNYIPYFSILLIAENVF
ncbi:MAG: hypothetical protein KKF16_10760 [Euryarchaeota archaeon]|nr:hypothetical protein [Euryarchaeota archaeon]MBV1730480.1 hypothetical protein [Methanobacterium sp.]MBV1755877.1 hypothetical protein [Methanobacterium sp.]MBV1767671.1 hypothetical protein [Methanobacterium sp.]